MKRFTLALLISATFASSADAANLLDIYREALASDAALASAKAAYQAGQEKLPQGRAGLLPTLDLSANSSWNQETFESRSASTSADYRYNSNSATLRLTQPIYRRQNWAQYEQGKLDIYFEFVVNPSSAQ